MQIDIGVTKNYMSLLEADKEGYFYKVLEGSSGSAKTFSVLQYLIEKALKKKRRIVAARHERETCSDSITADFIIVMMDHFKIWEGKRWNGTKHTYTFANGSTFKFRGTRVVAKLHGPRQDIFWGNEVMEMTYEAHRQIAIRTGEEVIYDFNPSLNKHWVFEKVQSRSDCKWIHSTFRDNRFIPPSDRAEILSYDPSVLKNVQENTADSWAWQVYGLGKRGRREGAIFEQYEVVDFWPDKNMCQRWGFGLDFGFSDDPTALIECALFQNKLYLREWVYAPKLITTRSQAQPNIPSLEGEMVLDEFGKSWKVVADCARPESIAELVAAGYNVSAATKGAGSILEGLNLMKRFPICVHRDSNNIQIELQQYVWKRHVNGDWLNIPEDKWNHAIDAARYWVLDELAGLRTDRRGVRRSRKAVKRKRY